MGEKRVIEQIASDEIYNDDWFLKDSVLHDTTKVQPSVIKEYMNQGMATSQDLADEATARQNMDNQLASGISKQMSNLADFYDTTKSYVVGDVCVLPNGELKRCIAPTSGAFDITKWESVTVDELFDALNFSADSISYDNTSSGLEANNVQDAIDEVVADVDAVETALETKAEQNGVYDDLVAGNLLSDSYTADNAPYLYRQSPSASSVSQNIVGGTVAWNQLVQNGNFASTSNWTVAGQATLSVSNNIANLTPTAQWGRIQQDSIPFITNHKYYCHYELKGKSTTTYSEINGTGRYVSGTDWNIFSKVIVGDSTKAQMVIFGESASSDFVTITIKNIQIIDLTQMFGTTIADYIYSLEQATAGSGIAWLKANGFLTKNYYPYDAGSLQSVKTSGRKIVGKNLFDKTKYSSLNSDYDYIEADYRCKRIQLRPNTTYKVSQRAQSTSTTLILLNKYSQVNRAGFFDTRSTSLNATFTTDESGCLYIGANNATDSAISQRLDECEIQIELGATATTYEPYTNHTYPLDSDLTLRGIPKLDANNNLYYDGDVYSADGSVKRKYGIVDLGTLDWTASTFGTADVWSTSLPSDCKGYTDSTIPTNVICLKYEVTSVNNIYSDLEKGIALRSNGSRLYVSRTDANSPTGYLQYELTTPTTESADAYENPQLVGSTEEFIDTRDVPIPVGGERKYHTDLKAKLEELAKIPDVPSANGTYTLKATRSASGVTYAWISD